MLKKKYIHRYKQGEIIFQEGDENDCAFLIESGQVNLYVNDGKAPVASVFKKEIFGASSAIGNSPRYTKAVAATDTECCLIFKEQLNERINESDPIVRILLTNYINRLRSSLKKNFDQEQDDKTKLTDIKSFGMGRMSKSDIKTEEQVIDLIHLENHLHQALEQQKFHMHFQPIINLKTGEPAGLEALIRLDSLNKTAPTSNVLSLTDTQLSRINPDDFMSIAEKTSLIVPLGHWIIRNSCAQFSKLKQSILKQTGKNPSLFISFNISGRQIIDPDFISILKKSITSNRLKAKEIKIEITEKELANEESVIKWVKEVCDMGCSVAIDDFGTGYTNFKFLSQFNIHNIKIDKSFIKEIHKGENKNKMQPIIGHLLQMSHDLGIQVIAEGIENRDTYNLLQKMQCDYGQGYYFAYPMPIERVFNWLMRDNKKKAA